MFPFMSQSLIYVRKKKSQKMITKATYKDVGQTGNHLLRLAQCVSETNQLRLQNHTSCLKPYMQRRLDFITMSK